jgi:hypothetical protein
MGGLAILVTDNLYSLIILFTAHFLFAKHLPATISEHCAVPAPCIDGHVIKGLVSCSLSLGCCTQVAFHRKL